MKTKLLQYSLTLFVFVSAIQANAQTIINSLTELKAQLGASNANIKMTPGTYYFNTTNCGTGKLFPSQEILLFTGSNSTFDFTGVRFEFASEIFSVYSGWAVQFWPTGNNNIYRNLTMEIIGNKTPNAGGESVHLDGNDNLIEGFHTTVRSCFPYGYGDIFGKGGGSVIGHKKRAGILVRGDRNHLLNCTVMMRSYGHGIFMQGAKDALIEGCHVEGETRTIREVLEEEGTGSPADNVNFMSVWGYDLRQLTYNYRFSLQEDGIRAYTNGVNYGTTESRPTTGTQVVNCMVIKMRSGVTIGWDYTAKRVENCTVLACETGYWFGSLATAIGCKGDASLGPLVSEDVGRSNSTIEVTLLDNYVPKLGNTPYFYFAGSGHKLTLHDGTSAFNPDVVLQVGGKRYAHRWLEGSGEEPLNMTASKLTFTNNTKYPISLESNASNNTIITCGLVTNKGTGNTITQSTSCSYNRPCANTATNLEAECYDNMSGVVIESLGSNNDRAVGSIQNGEWISFNAINITNMSSITAIAGTNKTGVSIEIREGSATGTLLGTLPIAVTTGFFDYQKTPAVNLLQIGSGTKNIFFVFKGPSGFLLNLDKISFIKDACATVSYNPFLPISAEDFCFSSGIVVENRTPINQSIGNINNGDYVVYSNVNFGLIDKYNSIELLASSGTDGGSIEVRSGAVNGELLATVDVKNTGGWTTYKSFSAFADKDISGTHNIYLVFKGESGFLFNIDNFKFYNDQCAGLTYNPYQQIRAVDYCGMFGVVPINNDYLGGIHNGDWIRYGSVDFGSLSPSQVKLRLAGLTETEGFVNIMLDDPKTGTLIATTTVPKTGAWTTWQEVTVPVNQSVTGKREVFVYFGNTSYNLSWFQFYKDPCNTSIVKSATKIEAEDYCEMSGIQTENSSEGTLNVGYINNNDWVRYKNIDLTNMKSIRVRVSGKTTASSIEVRTGSITGTLIGELMVSNTGGNQTWVTDSINLSKTLTGTQDVFLVFKGAGTGYLFNINWFGFSTKTVLVTGLDDSETSNFEIYPNPVLNELYIQNSLGANYKLYKVTGEIISKGEVTSDLYSIDMNGFNKGIYFVRIDSDTANSTKHFIKE